MSNPLPLTTLIPKDEILAILQKKTLNSESFCTSQYSNCSSCIQDERCGWCTTDQQYRITSSHYLLNTGFGKCLEGGLSGAIENFACLSNWYYDECPPCECNGHSNCLPKLIGLTNSFNEANVSSLKTTMKNQSDIYSNQLVCSQPCANNTTGEYCETCAQGYFGMLSYLLRYDL